MVLQLTNQEWRRLENLKYNKKTGKRRLANTYIAKIIVLKERGVSYNDIIKSINVSNTSIRKYYFDYKAGRIQDEKILELIDLYRRMSNIKVIRW